MLNTGKYLVSLITYDPSVSIALADGAYPQGYQRCVHESQYTVGLSNSCTIEADVLWLLVLMTAPMCVRSPS